jgi:NAD(P)-dependent dehydrogenase (short-subunit alcohol dehydrogenase family)
MALHATEPAHRARTPGDPVVPVEYAPAVPLPDPASRDARRINPMTDIGFDGKVAIITGSGGGLGRQHALELARRGARIVVNDLGGSLSGEGGDVGPAQAVVQEINALGGEAVADTNSVASPEGGRAVVNTAVEAFGTVDIVVNNAGILRDKSFHNLDHAMIEAVIQVHLLGAFYVTQPAYRIMREKGYGRIVSTSSNSGILGNFGQANYGAAKMGLVGLTRVLAIEGRKNNIKANAIAPVATTRMTEDMFGAAGEALDPALVSPLVAYLASEACEVSGEIYSAAGGIISRFFIGLTPGYYNPDLTAEDIAAHWDEIRDETGYIVPDDSSGEINKIVKTVLAK